jgi:hypothetical protein
MPESESFSISVDRLLQAVRPHGRTESCFPYALDEANSRRKDNERLQQWFVRMINEYCGGDTKVVAVEDNIAVFVKLGWSGKKQLVYANIQTLVTASDLDEYYLDADAQGMYLRMDFDYNTLGDPFSHPLAHIHVEGDLSPRFALDGGTCGNIVVDYFEFLYQNYVTGKWLKWAEREWEREFVRSSKKGEINQFSKIVDAFASSQFNILRDYSAYLARIKRALRNRKDDLFDLHMEGADREILEYPLARG